MGDVRAQTRETLANLRAVLEAAHARSTARFDLAALTWTLYIRRAEDVDAVRAELAQALDPACDALANAVMLQADICRSDLLVEIEAHGYAAGRLLPA
ncbi:MAG TPA: hypothetical protein VH328_02910 [Burkholderiaceae bacterium]|nr:hypothetical protein [Burkholderiaceae bacterium]